MIKRLAVESLNDRVSCDIAFTPDLNIITGKNGSGKTTVLKLLWYLISGNLERIFPEMSFDRAHIETDTFSLEITSRVKARTRRYAFTLTVGAETTEKDLSTEAVDHSAFVEQLNRKIAPISGASVFFPTFRRIEGGYTFHRGVRGHDARVYAAGIGSLGAAMAVLSDDMSLLAHRFVASISTQDIIELLTKKYADVSEQTNSLHIALSTYITERIRGVPHSEDTASGKPIIAVQDAESVLRDIACRVDEVSARSSVLLGPFSVLAQLVGEVFQYQGIRVTEGLTLGEAKEAISSDKLSAGEKQMLSFLVYNAFYSSSSIFIDEPELSLHADWQRVLFPTLLRQATGNQFIVATHSPFIYSKFPDKELVLNPDRGGE